jgi:hypothetical protein
LRERDGKEPLLVGNQRIITLENGVAFISKIMFTDNSRWLRGKKFRFGVKAMQNGEKIKEGRSQPFRVKDNRGECEFYSYFFLSIIVYMFLFFIVLICVL